MLVLSRKWNQSIRIDDEVVVTILRIQGENVRIGIEAPPEISVRREEIRRVGPAILRAPAQHDDA